MASTKSQGDRNYFKAVSKSAYSGSRVSRQSRALKSVRSQRLLRQKNDTKTVKSIKTVRTADIVNIINGAKLAEQVGLGLGGTIDDLNKENNEGDDVPELIYFDE